MEEIRAFNGTFSIEILKVFSNTGWLLASFAREA
jgi:hypothetical protein